MTSRAELVRRLVLAELVARRGEGPLAPRWAFARGKRRSLAPVVQTEPKDPAT